MEDISKTGRELLAGLRALARWLALGLLAGLCCGAAGALFYHAVAWAAAAREARPWLLWCMPAAGLVIVWSYRALGMGNDSGANQIIASVRSGEKPPLRLAFLIFLGSVLTHLTGGSAGREGAALQIGGSVTAALGRVLRLDERSMNVMVMCGMSGVFTALFGTPLSAAVFSLEVVSVGLVHYSALFPCLVTGLAAKGVAELLGAAPMGYELVGAPELGWLSLLRVGALAVLCALLSILFCMVMHRTAHLYQKYLPNPYLRVLAGAALVVALSLLEGSGDYNGAGGAVIARALSGTVATPWAFLIKLVFTALTLGAGFRGGEIVPAFFVGAAFGCAVGPLLGLEAGFAAAVCLTALFCGVVNCPLASVFLSVELFGIGGGAVLFFALACAVSFLVSGNFSLYSAQKIIYSKLEPKYINENAE